MDHKFFHTAVLAGAGTGKTYALVENYLCALFGFGHSGNKKRPQEILALTFTQKAAHEMRIRITRRLSELLSGYDNDEPLLRIANVLNQNMPDKEEIRRILRALPNAPIATFHGFCALLLRKEAQSIGIDDRFEILAPKDELMIARNILRPMVLSEIEDQKSPLRSLIARFRLGANLSSLGLLDGLLQLYFRLFEQGIECQTLEALAEKNQTNKQDLIHRVDEVRRALHYFSQIKSSDKTRVRLDEISRVFDLFVRDFHSEDERRISNGFKELRNSLKGNFGDQKARSDLVLTVVKLGADLVDYFLYSDERAVSRLLNQFHHAFSAYKLNVSLMSYSDLLAKTKEVLLKNHSLRAKIKERIRHVMVDEYQDTSPIQQDIISLLLENKNIHSELEPSTIIDTIDFTNGSSFFVVGDKKQSIYGFRGAKVALFDSLINKMKKTDGEAGNFARQLLTVNRRSSKPIIDLVNLVAAHTLTSQGYAKEEALHCTFDESTGRCGLWVFHKTDPGSDKTTSNLKCAAFGIAELLTSRPEISAKEIVVLVRRIKSGTRLKQLLSSLGISARIVGGEGFFQQQEIVDMLSALKLINDPSNELASAVVLRSPFILFSDQELIELSASEHGLSLHSASLLLQEGKFKPSSAERLRRFTEAIKEVSAIAIESNLAEALDVLIERCDIAYSIGLHDDAQQKWANIEKLRTLFIKAQRNPFSAIDEMYEHIFEGSKEPLAEGPIDKDAVTIMTIHQSKGLEFKVVVIADGESTLPIVASDFLVDENLGIAIKPRNRAISACAPSGTDLELSETRYHRIKNRTKHAEQNEIARLLYVALTRAKEELYVACSLESFSSKTGDLSLVGLFLRSFRESEAEFLSICDIKMIDESKPLLFKTIHNPLVEQGCIFRQEKGPIRLFASALQVPENSAIKNLVKNQVSLSKIVIDGNLAHRILAGAGSVLLSVEHINIHDADYFIDGVLRANGCDGSLAPELVKAVLSTLAALKGIMPAKARPIFEMPLCCSLKNNMVVEGFADLVMDSPDFVGVVEFKSSLRKVLDPNTYFQVLAYAHALSMQFEKPVKYAVAMVGALEINWNNYDEYARSLFLGAMLEQNPAEKKAPADESKAAASAMEILFS